MAYLTYDEYKSFGGKVSEPNFLSVINDIQVKLDYLTYGRIKKLDKVPDEVKLLLTRLVGVYSSTDYDRDTNISSYSNGIESISYVNSSEKSGTTSIDGKVISLCKEYLFVFNFSNS